MVEGVLKDGDVVLLVEDIATTGRQVLGAAKIITEAGATVKKIVCVIDRKQGAGENITQAGYKFESILTKKDLGIKNANWLSPRRMRLFSEKFLPHMLFLP